MSRSRLLSGHHSGPAALVVVAAVAGAIHGGPFPDLSVYRYGGRSVLDGLSPYVDRRPGDRVSVHLPAVRGGPDGAAGAASRYGSPPRCGPASSVGALAAVVVVVVGARSAGPRRGGWSRSLTGAAVALEPVWQNLAFGQVNLLLTLALFVHLLGPGTPLVRRPGRHRGGREADSPAVRRAPGPGRASHRCGARGHRVRGHCRCSASPSCPARRRTYWSHGLFDASRVGPPALAHNQSDVRRAQQTARRPSTLTSCGSRSSRCLLLSVCCCSPPTAGAPATACSARVWRRTGDAGRLTHLMVTPLGVGPCRSRSSCGSGAAGRAPAWVAVFVARPIVWPGLWPASASTPGLPFDHVVGNAYQLAAFALCLWAVVQVRQDRGHVSDRGARAAHIRALSASTSSTAGLLRLAVEEHPEPRPRVLRALTSGR